MKSFINDRKAFNETKVNIKCFFLLICLIFSLFSCGGGGSGGSGGVGGGGSGEDTSAQPIPGPGDTENYFPFTQGNTWIFQGATSETGMSPVNFFNTIQITGTKLINGVTTTVLTESNSDNSGTPEEFYRLKNNNGISYYGSKDATDILTPQFTPYQEFKFPLATGSSFVQIDKRGLGYGSDLNGDGITEKVDVYSVITVKGFETVNVQVGTFYNVAKIETTVTLTIILSNSNSKFIFTLVGTEWFSPGVGLVKRTGITTFPDSTSVTVNEELIGYTVDGQSKGIMPQFTMAGGLAPANSDSESPGRPSIGYDGTNYLVVSRRVVNWSTSTMIGTLISGNGSIIKSFDISAQGSNRSAVSFDGNNYLVVSAQNGQIMGQRISPSGALLDGSAGFAISSGTPNVITNYNPAVAFDGTNYMVVWGKYINGYDIYGAKVTPNGQVLNEFPIFQAAGEQISPSIAFDGTNYFIVWRDTRSGSGPSSNTDIYGIRITPGGVILDPAGIAISTAPGYQGEPQIIFDGINYFAAWLDQRNSFSYLDNDIYGTRITPDGTLLDGPSNTGGVAINTAAYNSSYVSVSFDGGKYFVVWAIDNFSNNPLSGIFGARVSTSGNLIDGPSSGSGISISGLPPSFSRYVYPTIFFNGNNSLLTWINNIELSGTTKDIRGVLIYPF